MGFYINIHYILIFLISFSQLNLLSLASPLGDPSDYPKHEPGVLYLYDKAISLDDGYELSIQGVLAGIIFFLLGLALFFRGMVDAKGELTRFNIGFITFGLVSWVMLTNFEPASTYGVNRWSLYLAVVVAIGLFGGLLVCSCDKIAAHVALLGALGGLSFGLWILGWVDGLSIKSTWGRALLLCLLALFWFFLASYSVHFNVLASSMVGAYLLILGFDVYFHTGFTYCVLTALDANPAHAHDFIAYNQVRYMQAGLMAAVIIGYYLQVLQRSLNSIKFHFENRYILAGSLKPRLRAPFQHFYPQPVVV